ncbi:histidine phosphatase family protein [Spelaeicoccus albus]|uniref:Putative phosphoglycerate mutase n=1 Tax=Spelaeicoccus albus TaxID=1280376 RepID=A0A7Z0D4R3_9MICO|nr:histidine phosphatase family protein [Spelaeicoccus albus]NYI68867.1 putative phosphoglycerate mutase [Spelaeicoccus albus]
MTIDTRDIYLARHGETAFNADGRLRGLADPPLNDTGVAEAERLADALARRLTSEPNSAAPHVLSSPLDRAVHTARIIASALGATNAVDERWNDRDYGPQTGKIKSEVIERWGSVDDAPGVEPLSAVVARVRPALDAAPREIADGPIVIVTHDAVIRALIRDLDPRRPALESPTASWNHLRGRAGCWEIAAVDRKPGAGA